MSVWNTPLAMSVVYNPLTDSPYVQQEDIGFTYPPPGADDLLTEGGTFILTEGLAFITTE